MPTERNHLCQCPACVLLDAMDYRIFHRASVRVYRWVRRKWRYRASNMRRLRAEQQEINAIAAGTDRDDFYMAIIHDLLSEIPPDKESL